MRGQQSRRTNDDIWNRYKGTEAVTETAPIRGGDESADNTSSQEAALYVKPWKRRGQYFELFFHNFCES